MHFREATSDDGEGILALYRRVARFEGGIARLEDEVTPEYVRDFVDHSIRDGHIIVALHPDDPTQFIAEIHAYKKGLKVFDHVLTDLTLVVDPEFQSRKIGRTILKIFLDEISTRTVVGKVELIARETNVRAIQLYQSLGFRIEGRLEMRIRTTTGNYEADIPMGWQNPNFEF